MIFRRTLLVARGSQVHNLAGHRSTFFYIPDARTTSNSTGVTRGTAADFRGVREVNTQLHRTGKLSRREQLLAMASCNVDLPLEEPNSSGWRAEEIKSSLDTEEGKQKLTKFYPISTFPQIAELRIRHSAYLS